MPVRRDGNSLRLFPDGGREQGALRRDVDRRGHGDLLVRDVHGGPIGTHRDLLGIFADRELPDDVA